MARITRGEWSRAYAFTRDGHEYVARFSPTRDDFDKDARAARFASPRLPVPAPIEIGEAPGGFFAVAARVAGTFVDDLDDGGMRVVLPSLFAALDAMRESDLSPSSGFGLWRPDGDAPHPTWRAALVDIAHDRRGSRTHGWRARLDASPHAAAFDEAYAWLESLAAAVPDARHLVHSDLLNYNVLARDDRIAAVLDWGSSIYGDFLYDVAWLSFWAPWYPAWRDIDFEREARRHYDAIGLDVSAFAERIACCKLHIGLDGMAYNAFRENYPALAATTARTLALTRV